MAFAGTREREEASAVGASIVGGSGGILPRKIFEPRVSQMPFPGLWGKILRNSDGQKKYNGQKTLVKQDAYSDVHTGLAAINQSMQIYLNTVKSSVHG